MKFVFEELRHSWLEFSQLIVEESAELSFNFRERGSSSEISILVSSAYSIKSFVLELDRGRSFM